MHNSYHESFFLLCITVLFVLLFAPVCIPENFLWRSPAKLVSPVSGLNLNVAYVERPSLAPKGELFFSNSLLKHTVLFPHTPYRDWPKTKTLACGFIYQCLSPGSEQPSESLVIEVSPGDRH